VVNASYNENGAWKNHEQQIENKPSQNSPWLGLEKSHRFFSLIIFL
jgi:hypothetical protein